MTPNETDSRGGSDDVALRAATPWASPGHLFSLVRTGRANRRTELQRVTGLSRSTVTGRVDQLLASGLLRDSAVQRGERGRPSSVLSFSEDYGVALVADLGATHARVAICDLSGESLVERSQDRPISDGPERVLGWLERTWAKQLAHPRVAGRLVVGVGLGVPGPVDVVAGQPVRPPIMPGWGGYPVRDRLADRFQVPTFLDNDANIMALGEFHAMAPQSPVFLFVKAASGIGAGIVIDGQVFRGATGGSGDIGHIKLAETAPQNPCACGATGCLAAAASGAAVAHQLRELGRPVASSRGAVRLAVNGDAEAVALVRQAGLLLGDVLATSVSLLNPDVLMIGGDLQLAQDHFMAALKERIYQRTQPLATRDMRILTSALGERAGIVGAARLVIDSVFSAESVDRMLTG